MDKNEGEFTKRIEAILSGKDLEPDASFFTKFGSDESKTTVKMELIGEVVAEAKHDFPMFRVLGVATRNHEKGDPVEMRPMTSEEENQAMKKWFVRWFGAAEQKE